MIRLLSVSIFLTLGLCAVWLNAEEGAVGRAVEIDGIKSRIAEIESDSGIQEVVRSLAVVQLNEAVSFLEQASVFESKKQEYREALENGARDINRMQAEGTALDESTESALLPPNISEDSEMSVIEAALAHEQVSLADARSELSAINAAIAETKASPTSIRDRLIAVRTEIVEVDSQLGELESANQGLERETKELVLSSRRTSLIAESSMLEQQSLSYDIRMARSGAVRTLAEKRVEVTYSRIGALQALANVRLNSEVDRAEVLFRRVQKLAPGADGSVANLISELENLISETRAVSEQLESTAMRIQEREALLRTIVADFDSVRRQIEIGGLEGTFARILLERRRTLPGALEERQLIRQIRMSLTESQRTLYYLENLDDDNTEEKVEDAAQVAGSDSDDAKQLRREARELRATRDRLSEDLVANYRRLIRELGELDLIEQQIDQESTKYRDFLAEQLFWVRSSPFLNADAFRGIFPAFAYLFGPHRFVELMQQLKGVPMWYYTVVSILLAGLMLMRRRFRAELEMAGDQTRRISTDRYDNTARAFFLTIALALPLPILLLALGAGLRNHSGATEWAFGLGSAFISIGVFLFLMLFTREIGRKKGLGAYHFKWRGNSLVRVHRLFRRLAVVYIPLTLIICLVVAENNTDHFDSIGRMAALIGGLAIGMIFIYFSKPQLDGEEGAEKVKYIFFSNKVAFWGNIIITIGLVVLLLIGFVVTALLLMVELQMTILAVYLAFIVHGMLLRWFEIKERRMALAEAISRRRARLKAAEEEEEEEEEAPNESEELLVEEAEKEQQLDLVEVGEQTRNVISFLVGVGLLITLWYLWTELAPVLTVLDTINTIGSFSIADLAVSVLVIAVTVSITRNLPGLLEMLVLRRLDIIPGTRAAIITLSQYAVTAIGAMALFRHIGVDWSQFGWIAAALSVGLGFGLQEVVANFICGIILLFERPIRVGDVVSVAGVSGTVSKIKMRATTIVNFDREEFVVPNKEFITGSLINMTLSSPINRVLIPVGVAYGSDTEEVLRILSEVAKGVDGVMEEPAPVITFESFGDSSLDFMVRAYLPSRENRLGVITELHRQIDRRFAEANIEIPFPQRDLHLRSVDEDIPFRGQSKP